ncbi:copper amine oxidase N-terminal domain-containing protein [Acetivibrio sp. MSJd-27]|uniref:copper amine oxidase N-terminal domain-containing protein n=1 Tax=Acetivibrio sp. MSJd-27 TaxID=2841523 RepID=UPI0015AAFFA7|nr:copper amine oxidase N-terminal domain-containing protein [Acetivibrio sp. MSJd-27]MBU5450915.1 copper amine oxidase N-terminal domain-containing protein [Acetivibrio sp. MSJd-27]
MKKKVISLLLTTLLLCSFFAFPAAADNDIRIILSLGSYDNCEFLECDVPPVIVDGYTLIPLRALAEKLGFTVEWFAEDQTVYVKTDTDVLMLTIDMKIVGVNGNPVEIPVAPKIVNDRAMLPLRFIAEYFNKKVIFNGEGDVKYIWITDFDYLQNNELNIDDNYRAMGEIEPFYSLKQDGITNKGIRIGSALSDVTSAYGNNAKIEINTSGYTCLTYYTLGIPNSGSRGAMHFNFKNNILVSVEIELPN